MATLSPSLDDALQDVEARFLNLPENELNQPQRLFFQIEQAYWYYEDFKADRFAHLPHFSTLKSFASKIFTHCEILSNMTNRFQELFADFASYKSKIPVCGCIMLNPSMTKMVMVCNWKSDWWSFPRGKMNEGELELDCAVREVEEETGFNSRAHCNESDYVVTFQDQKKIQLFIAINVPENTPFAPQTRKEVSDIQFHPIDKLPANTYHVHPFVPKLKRWIKQKQKQLSGVMKSPKFTLLTPTKILQATTTSTKNKPSNKLEALTTVLKMNTPTRILKRNTDTATTITAASTATVTNVQPRLKNEFDLRNADTFAMYFSSGDAGTGGDGMNGAKRWSVEEMFTANKKLTGREYDYDGNPHSFGNSHPRYVNYRADGGGNSQPATTTTATTATTAALLQTTPSTDLAFLEFSKQSYQLGGKLLRGKEYSFDSIQPLVESKDHMIQPDGIAAAADDDELLLLEEEDSFIEDSFVEDSFVLPPSSTAYTQQLQLQQHQQQRSRSFFPTPISFNQEEILQAMDEILRQHPIQ